MPVKTGNPENFELQDILEFLNDSRTHDVGRKATAVLYLESRK